MLEKVLKLIFMLVIIGAFISVIILTNDGVKMKINAGNIVPVIVIFMVLIGVEVIMMK